MKKKILELKQLALAYSLSIKYGSVPAPDKLELDDIMRVWRENPKYKYSGDPTEIIRNACGEYEGCSPHDLESKAFGIIRDL